MSYLTGAPEIALEYMKDHIRSGKWVPGSRIPTEEQLCERLNISRIALRQAITTLDSFSVLRKVQGSGTYVNEASEASIMGLPYYPVSEERVRMVLEFRRMFDPYNTILFCENANEDDLKKLEDNYTQMVRAGEIGDEAQFHDLDNEFHALIARGTHNAIIIQLCDLLMEVLRYYQAELICAPGFQQASRYHGYILRAIKDHDPDIAFLTCRRHIDKTLTALRENKAQDTHPDERIN